MRISDAPEWLKKWAVFFSFELLILLGCTGLCALIRLFMIPNIIWEDEVSLTYSNICPLSKEHANNMCDFPSAEVVLADNNVPVSGGQFLQVSGADSWLSVHLHCGIAHPRLS
ncbi:hypothetical protein FGIG_11169 [Fasciola gigantica]|uniref:Seipin n=1 Tax=Fasciola gigantica TaxID=46835 RepID=A0A504YRQ7_FASGI|nr:hypothetical protein FGIG_11169 [Fasciola gigantica]